MRTLGSSLSVMSILSLDAAPEGYRGDGLWNPDLL